MAGRGTGVPNWFRCSKARGEMEPTEHNVERTGRTRKAAPGKVQARTLDTEHEYECSCGHRGWSKHQGVLERPVSLNGRTIGLTYAGSRIIRTDSQTPSFRRGNAERGRALLSDEAIAQTEVWIEPWHP